MVNGVNAKVIVMPKAAVLDPQGNAVRDAMRHLGMPEVRSVRIGKYMEIEIEGQDGELESRLHQLCRDLLSNPVIEDYELQRDRCRTSDAFARDYSGQGRAEIRRRTPINREQASNSDKSRAGAQHPKSKTKGTRLRPATARQARKSLYESAAIFFLRGISAACSADDRTHREFLSKHHFDVARLDTRGHPCVSRRERLPRGATRSRVAH